jgi:hypothetical protein
MNKFEKIQKKWDKIDREIFAIEIAKVMLELKSSHVYFIIQQAFDRESMMGWDDVEIMLRKVIDGKK